VGQAADFAQGERNLSFRRQSGMAAGEDQTEAIVLKTVLFIGPFRRTRLHFEISHELVLRWIKSCAATQSVNGFESGRRKSTIDFAL
jgi:hypothetical protein